MRRWIIASLALAAVSADVTAADPDRGARLYENHCTTCHGSVAHERTRRKADSWQSLLAWVERWRSHLELDWTAVELEDVAAYLDRRFYGFGSRTTQ